MPSQKRALAQLEEFHKGSNKMNLGRGVFALVTSDKRTRVCLTARSDCATHENTDKSIIRIGEMFQAVLPELTYDSVDRGDIVWKKRTRDSEIVSIVLNQAQTEYDGCSTGDVVTSIGTITEEELREKFKIDLKTSFSIVDGDTTPYKPLADAFHKLNKDPGPYSKVLVMNVQNDGEPDSDYERERDLHSDA
tara:strand:+ start:757 stop:1332 length:576 start_codon:yes stop_codon:yes gene_type:complete